MKRHRANAMTVSDARCLPPNNLLVFAGSLRGCGDLLPLRDAGAMIRHHDERAK
jgi:hypothetical protein